MKNPVNWFEIATKDLERAKAFYAAVFKSEFQSVDMPDGSKMYMFNGDPEATGALGALISSPENTPCTDGTLVYFGCDDIANELGRVEEAGGKVLFPKMDIGQFGFISQIIDTEGNRVGLHSNQ